MPDSSQEGKVWPRSWSDLHDVPILRSMAKAGNSKAICKIQPTTFAWFWSLAYLIIDFALKSSSPNHPDLDTTTPEKRILCIMDSTKSEVSSDTALADHLCLLVHGYENEY